MKSLLALLLVLDLNTATIEQLRALPGVGPALARRIVEFREKKGGFRRVEELLAISGITERKYKQIRPHVKVSTMRREVPEGPGVSRVFSSNEVAGVVRFQRVLLTVDPVKRCSCPICCEIANGWREQ